MRIARQNIPGVNYHLIWRFVDREFRLTDDYERQKYLALLGNALANTDWRCTAYALMSNHLHFSFVAGRQPLSSWSKRVNCPFARWMNARHAGLGPLMADRPKQRAIRSEHERYLLAYIHNNPVRAGVVVRARDSSWTSHACYVGLAEAPAWLHVELGLERSGIPEDEFDAWVNGTAGDSDVPALAEIRRAARRRGAVEIATPAAGSDGLVPLVAKPFAYVRPDPRLLVRVAADALELTEAELCSRKKTRRIVAARMVAVRCGSALGIAASDIAAALAISPAAVSALALRELDQASHAGLQIAAARLEVELVSERSEDRPQSMLERQVLAARK